MVFPVPAQTLSIVSAGLGLILACKSGAERAHETLAQALAQPYAELCAVDSAQDPHCTGMCQVWVSVQRAHAHAVASQQLLALATSTDPETEALLVQVREKARGVGAVLGNVCLTNFDALKDKPHDQESLPRIVTCSDAAGQSGPAVNDLHLSLTALAEHVRTRSGVLLPSHLAPCGPAS